MRQVNHESRKRVSYLIMKKRGEALNIPLKVHALSSDEVCVFDFCTLPEV